MPNSSDIPHLIALLDDDEPAVRESVTTALQSFGGDISEEVAGIDISPADQQRLRQMLHPQRRIALRDEWQVPTTKLASGHPDWETFESLARLISDYLHDGISIRPSLSDELDILAEECRNDFPEPDADDLRHFLFVSGRLRGNSDDFYDPANTDLCATIDSGQGNPIGLAVIYILIGQRLGLDIQPCNFPSHFLARTEINGTNFLVDCFHGGRLIEVTRMLDDATITREAIASIRQPVAPGKVLKRMLSNLAHAWSRKGEPEDEALALQLAATLGTD